MKRFLLFISFLTIPVLLFSLSEKECKHHLTLSCQEMSAASLHLQTASNKPTDAKIHLVSLAIQCYQRAIIYLDIILNDIQQIKISKIKPWQNKLKTECNTNKEICLNSICNLNENLIPLNIVLFAEEKEKEGNALIKFANEKSEASQFLSGQEKIVSLKEISEALNKAISFFLQPLTQINQITDITVSFGLFGLQKKFEGVIKNLRESIVGIEAAIHQTADIEKASLLFVSGELKLTQAASLIESSFPASLKDISQVEAAFDESLNLYRAALSDYLSVLQLLTLYSLENDKQFIQSKIAFINELIENHKIRISENSIDKQADCFKNQFAVLEKMEASLNIYKKMEAILIQLTSINNEYDTKLNLIRDHIVTIENAQTEKKDKIFAKDNDYEFLKKEKERTEEFFKAQSSKQEGIMEHAIALNGCMVNCCAPFAVAMDAKYKEGDNKYLLFQEQFYHFFVQSQIPCSSITVEVFQNLRLVHREKIPLPQAHHIEWNEFVTDEGMVRIPKTKLNSDFGLEIQLIAVPGNGHKHAFVIKQKVQTSDYQFVFSSEMHSLYECSFTTLPPSQLNVLCKPGNILGNKPLSKFLPDLSCLDSIFSNLPDSELNFDSLLDNFVEEMTKDPLLLAQYGQNEIEFVEPLLSREGGTFLPPKIQRSALGTFLEKQGTPWEQCALLVCLLRKAGYQAVYAEGPAFSVPVDYAERLLTVQLSGQKEAFLKYPWVLFFDGNSWISLFPWMKDIKFEEGYDLYDFLPEKYASAERWIKQYLCNDPTILQHIGTDDNDTAAVLFERFMESHLRNYSLSLQDVGVSRSINKKQFASWKDFPRLNIKENFGFILNLEEAPNLFNHVMIHIASRENPEKKIMSPWISLPEVTYTPYSIHFEPAKEINHILYFQQFGNHKATYQLELNPTDLNIDVKIFYGCDQSNLFQTFTMAKGTSAALCFNTGGSHAKVPSFFGHQYSNAVEEKTKVHALLSFMGAVYFNKCAKAEATLSKLHKLPPSTLLNFGLAKLSPDTSNSPLKGFPDLRFPQVDMYRFSGDQQKDECLFNFHQNLNLAKRQLSALVCTDASSNEHQVLKELFNDPYAISTVKLLQIAHEIHQNKKLQGLGFLNFTDASFNMAEENPILARCFYFNHLPELNLGKIKSQAKEQWNQAKDCLKNTMDSSYPNFSYAYMTPGPISSKDGDAIRLPSYTGIGTLIIHKTGSLALISNGSHTTNGGYGSRFSDNILTSIINNDWKIVQNNERFSLIDSQFSPTFNGVNSDNLDLFSLSSNTKAKDNLSYFSHFSDSNISKDSQSYFSQFTEWKSDIRPAYKSFYDSVADPVDVVSGAFFIDETDLTLPGLFPLQIRRNYSSQNLKPGIMGIGWKISLNPYLIEEGEHLYASEEDGTIIDYRFNPETSRWEVFLEDNLELRNENKKGIGGIANPYHAYLEKENSSFILHGTDGSLRLFENSLLKKWTDAAGNFLSFIYQENRLTRIENSEGSFLGFYYNYEGKISEAFTKDGRRVYYNYDLQDNLIQVEMPNGAVTTYEYNAFHQMIKETKPHGKLLINSYDASGRISEQQNPHGIRQSLITTAKFNYNENVTTVTDAAGACTEYKIYHKQIYKITDPLGNQIFHSSFIDANSWFDAESEELKSWKEAGGYPRSLKTSKDKRGLITEYVYDAKGNPIEIILKGSDLNGKGVQQINKNLEYNQYNLCISEKVLNKRSLTTYDSMIPYLPKKIETYVDDKLTGYLDFQYNGKGQLTYENRSGAITIWEYDPRGFPIKKIQKTGTENPDIVSLFQYNHQGQCIEQTSADAIIRTEYDIMGNPCVSSVYSLSEDLISIKYTGYNLNQALIWQIGAEQNESMQIDYNAAGLPKAFRQHLSKARIEGSDLHIEAAGVAYSLFDYDTRGHLILEVNPNGQSTFREYDLLGRISSMTKAGQTSEFFYEAGGLISEILSPNGEKIIRKYSTNGLLIKETYPDGTENNYEYDLYGRLTCETKNGVTLHTEYDDIENRIIKKHKEKILKVETFDLRGNLTSSIDAYGNTTKKTYDALNRLISDVDSEGYETTWNYLEDTITCILPTKEKNWQRYQAGKVVESQTFDPQGNLIASMRTDTCPFSNSSQEIKGDLIKKIWRNTQGKPLVVLQEGLLTVYHYDPCGNCIAVADGENRLTNYQYDSLGRLIKKTLPDATSLTYEYDSLSNLIACNLPNGIAWKAEYDASGRKMSEGLHGHEAISQQWKYIYDQGRLKEAIDPNLIKHSYFYDDLGRVIKEEAGCYSRHYTYDLRGLLTNIEQKGNGETKIERSYTSNGKLASESIFLNSQLLQRTHQTWEPGKRTLQIGDHIRSFQFIGGHLAKVEAQGVSLNYSYNKSGLLEHSFKNDSETSYLYYPSGMPKNIISQIKNQEYQQAFDWDRSGKMARYWSNATDDEQKFFSYDTQGRLKAINEELYSFDFGQPGCSVRTEAPNWRVPEVDGLDPFGKIIAEISEGKGIYTTYDAAGQTVCRSLEEDEQHFTWDPWGNLTEVKSKDYTWQAFYDPLGRRLQTLFQDDEEEQVIISLYDPEKEFEEIGVKFNEKTFWKLFGNNKGECLLTEKGNIANLVYNELGTLIAVTDSENIYLTNHTTSPYGPQGPPSWMEPDLMSFALSHHWQSRRTDPTGFIWMGARYYDPKGGKFLSRDPVGIPHCLDLYAYANGDPVNFNDPDGRFSSAVYDSWGSTTFDISTRMAANFFGSPSKNPSLNPAGTHNFWEASIEPPGVCFSSYFEKMVTCSFEDSLEQASSHKVGTFSKTDKLIISNNGMNMNLQTALEAGRHISDLAGGHEVHVVHNPTRGICSDVFRWMDVCKLGNQTPVNNEIQNLCDNFLKTASKDARILITGFSEGVTTSMSFTRHNPDLRNKIEILAYCPSAYIEKDLCKKIIHYCSQGDLIHRIVFEGFKPGKENVVFLPRHPEAGFIDHDAKSPTFTESLTRTIDQYLGY